MMKQVYIALLCFLVGCMSIPDHYDTSSTADGFDLMRPEGVPEKMPSCSYSELQGEEIILATKSEVKQESYYSDSSISPAEIGYFSIKVEPSLTADHISYRSYRNKEGKIVTEVGAQEKSNYPLSDNYHKIILSNCDIVYINTGLAGVDYVRKTIYSEAKSMIEKEIWVDRRRRFRNIQESYQKNAKLEHLEKVNISDIMLASYVDNSNSSSGINIISPLMLEVETEGNEEALIPYNTDYYFQNDPLDPEWSNSIVSAIKNQDYRIGMSQRQVMLAVGRPSDINRDVGDWGVHEQWVYSEGVKDFYLYFENGELKSYQE
ncbi:hypothetical protein [Rhodohalobacter sp. 8-1]|uniref:hypothetical protein n=1 Tax=Rhodohalobacter sp. 8-1 TaxID=3131972 RepID=UPI0030EC0322